MTEVINRSAFTSLTAFLTPHQRSLPLQQTTYALNLLQEHINVDNMSALTRIQLHLFYAS